MTKRSGLYYWAGPGTERMIQLKYPGAKLNSLSFHRAYDEPALTQAVENLGVTDAFISYSWGFNSKTEQPDYQFTHDRLDNFSQLGIRTHAYIQGTNLVYQDHLDKDYYCRNQRDQLIPYHRGRKMTCINNPYFIEYLINKISKACQENISGIYIDNMHFGLFPLFLGSKKLSFFGCHCRYCQKIFRQETNQQIPSMFRLDELLTEYLDFRVRSMDRILKTLSQLAHNSGKEFGTNSFDPKLPLDIFYGTSLEMLDKYQDYLLFENHDLPGNNRNNLHLKDVIAKVTKPVFVVSYKKGIGREKQFIQSDYDAIYTESQNLGYHPCYKATEFTTNGRWHVLDMSSLQPVQQFLGLRLKNIRIKKKNLPFSWLHQLYNRWYVSVMNIYFERRIARRTFNWLYYKAVR